MYQVDLKNNLDDKYKYYLGLTETAFQERFNPGKWVIPKLI